MVKGAFCTLDLASVRSDGMPYMSLFWCASAKEAKTNRDF